MEGYRFDECRLHRKRKFRVAETPANVNQPILLIEHARRQGGSVAEAEEFLKKGFSQ